MQHDQTGSALRDLDTDLIARLASGDRATRQALSAARRHETTSLIKRPAQRVALRVRGFEHLLTEPSGQRWQQRVRQYLAADWSMGLMTEFLRVAGWRLHTCMKFQQAPRVDTILQEADRAIYSREGGWYVINVRAVMELAHVVSLSEEYPEVESNEWLRFNNEAYSLHFIQQDCRQTELTKEKVEAVKTATESVKTATESVKTKVEGVKSAVESLLESVREAGSGTGTAPNADVHVESAEFTHMNENEEAILNKLDEVFERQDEQGTTGHAYQVECVSGCNDTVLAEIKSDILLQTADATTDREDIVTAIHENTEKLEEIAG